MKKKVYYILSIIFFIVFNFNIFPNNNYFKFPRIIKAIKEKDEYLRKLFKLREVPYPNKGIYIRVFKLEKLVELWAFSPNKKKYILIKVYRICKTSGVLGPKRRENDLQIPEGFYYMESFNPQSRFFISIKINYPNKSDLIRGNKKNPGGNIFIHGNCVSRGCIPITDNFIKELFWVTLQARDLGEKRIPVHIFPFRMSKWKKYSRNIVYNIKHWQKFHYLVGNYHPKTYTDMISFWKELKSISNYFEKYKNLPLIKTGNKGEYFIVNK